jgi:hypothetical protein
VALRGGVGGAGRGGGRNIQPPKDALFVRIFFQFSVIIDAFEKL